LQQGKNFKDDSKRTIADGFRKGSDLEAPSSGSTQKTASRAQTGINRRFQTQNNSRQQVAV